MEISYSIIQITLKVRKKNNKNIIPPAFETFPFSGYLLSCQVDNTNIYPRFIIGIYHIIFHSNNLDQHIKYLKKYQRSNVLPGSRERYIPNCIVLLLNQTSAGFVNILYLPVAMLSTIYN